MGYKRTDAGDMDVEYDEGRDTLPPLEDIMDYYKNEKDLEEKDDDVIDDEPDVKSVETYYSWLIMLFGLVGHVLYYGIAWTVGVYQVIFLEAFRKPAATTALIGSINTASLYFLAPMGGLLVNRFGCRSLVITGSLISAGGLFVSFFANSIYLLYFTFGLMAGGGAGLAFIPLLTCVSRYFDKRRALAVGVASSGNGIGLMIMPPLIRYLDDTYGWRGSLVILGALLVQFVFLGALMKHIQLPEDDNVDSLNEVRIQKSGVIEILQLSIFKEKRYLLLCLNNVFLMYGISVVFVHLAAYGISVGVKDSAWLFTALGASTYIGRLLFGLLGQWKRTNFVLVYCAALLVAGLPVVILPKTDSLWGMMTVASVFGFGTSVIGPYLPQLNIEFLGLQKMPAGYGYLLVFEGLGTLLGAPSAGTLFDQTQIYDYSFYVGGCSIILSAFVMLPAWKWIEPSRFQQQIILEEKSALGLQDDDPGGKSLDRSHLSLYQSHQLLAESLSRLRSRPDLRHLSSLNSLQRSHLSLPRSFSSRLTLNSHGLPSEMTAPIVAV